MVRRKLTTKEACEKTKKERGMVEPAGHPKEEDLLKIRMAGAAYTHDRIVKTSKSEIERQRRKKKFR